MSLDAMKQALEALEELADEVFAPYDNKLGDAILALRAAIEQAQGLAEKVPARGTLLEQTLGKVWDEMPHTALMDAIIGGTGVMLGDKRIDPASIYKQPDQEPVAWVNPKWLNPKTRHWTNDTILHKPIAGWVPLYTAPRQWQGLTDEEIEQMMDYWSEDARSAYGGARSANGEYVYIPDIIRDAEKRLKEKNNG